MELRGENLLDVEGNGFKSTLELDLLVQLTNLLVSVEVPSDVVAYVELALDVVHYVELGL